MRYIERIPNAISKTIYYQLTPLIAPSIFTDTVYWVPLVVARPPYSPALWAEEDSTLARYGCWADIPALVAQACQDLVLATCHR